MSATVMPAVLQVTGLDKGAAADVLEKDVEKNILTKLSEGKYADSFMAFEKRVRASRLEREEVLRLTMKLWKSAECLPQCACFLHLCIVLFGLFS